MKTALLAITIFLVIISGLFIPARQSPDEDARAELLARQAYLTAQTYFLEAGGARVDRMTLKTLGFSAPSDVNLEITDGRREYLKIRIFHTKGGFVYEVDAKGGITKKHRSRIAALVSSLLYEPAPEPVQSPPLYSTSPSPDTGIATRNAARRAHRAARYFFNYRPEGTLTKDDLGAWGGSRDDGITVDILDGRREYLRIRARHPESGVVWEVDSDGNLTSPAQAPKRADMPERPLKPSRIATPEAADQEARETAVKVFSLSRSYLSEYRPAAGLKLDALKRAHPEYSIPPDVTVEVLDRREETLRLRVSHRLGSKTFEVDPEGGITARPLS